MSVVLGHYSYQFRHPLLLTLSSEGHVSGNYSEKSHQDDYLPGQNSLVSVCFQVYTSHLFLVSRQKDLRPADRSELFVIVRQPGGYTTGWISLSCYSNGEHHSR